MTARLVGGVLLRMLVVSVVVGWMGLRWPGIVVAPLTPLVRSLVALSGSYIQQPSFQRVDATLQITGELHPRMTQRDGSLLPAARGTWTKQTGPTVQLLVVAFAVWAAVPVARQRKLRALLVMVPAALLVCAFQLTVEIHETALRHLGQVWLPTLTLPGTEENLNYFAWLESRYRVVQWIKSFNDGGGALFLAVWAGLIGYVLPARRDGVRPAGEVT
jgi:hypothetical protein